MTKITLFTERAVSVGTIFWRAFFQVLIFPAFAVVVVIVVVVVVVVFSLLSFS